MASGEDWGSGKSSADVNPRSSRAEAVSAPTWFAFALDGTLACEEPSVGKELERTE